MGYALLQYYEPFPFVQPEEKEWDEWIFGNIPWCESFDRMIPQRPNADAPVKSFVLEADLPDEPDEDCIYPGDRMRFTHSVLHETRLEDHLLKILAVEESGSSGYSYPREFTSIAARADSYAKTIAGFRTGKSITSGMAAITGPAHRVLAQDTVDGNIYSVSPKLLRRDG